MPIELMVVSVLVIASVLVISMIVFASVISHAVWKVKIITCTISIDPVDPEIAFPVEHVNGTEKIFYLHEPTVLPAS